MDDAVPLLIAVVGHRDPKPDCIPEITSYFSEYILQLQKQLPSTPLWLMTGLAEGADQLAAQAFLDVIRSSSQKGTNSHKLISVLPKPECSYIEDFDSTQKKIEFQNLLDQSDIVLTPENSDLFRGHQAIDLPCPDCYARHSAFLLRYCYILIAFNNGVDNHERGGTSQSVAIQRGLVHSTFEDVDEVIATREPGSLIEINTPRYKNEFSAFDRQPVTFWLENRQVSSIDDLLDIPRYIDELNSKTRECDVEHQSWHARPSLLWRTLDASANYCKAVYLKRTNWLLLLGFLISLSLADPPWQTLGLLGLVFAISQYPKLQQKAKQDFIVYRATTEALTVQEFWCDYDIDIDATDLLRLNLERKMNWIRTLLRTIKFVHSLRLDEEALSASDVGNDISAWINNQIHYLEVNTKKFKRYRQVFTVSLSLIFVVTIFGATGDYFSPGGIFKWLFELGIATAVIVVGFYELRGYEEMNTRYLKSLRHFIQARNALDQAYIVYKEPPFNSDSRDLLSRRIHAILEAIGREKIDELNDWFSDQLKRSYSP